jgi:hypothetical protein
LVTMANDPPRCALCGSGFAPVLSEFLTAFDCAGPVLCHVCQALAREPVEKPLRVRAVRRSAGRAGEGHRGR